MSSRTIGRFRASYDPYWTSAKWLSRCKKCSAEIPKGGMLFYYPKDRYVLCQACGAQPSRDLEAAKFDEAQMSGGMA